MPILVPKNAEQKKWLKDRSKKITGFCNDINKPAQCEGTKPKSTSGKPMPTCEAWSTCPCKCHYEIDQIFAMTGQTRTQAMTNPDYKPDYGDFVLPTPSMVAYDTVAFVPGPTLAPDDMEQTITASLVPVAATLATRVTPTGRAARGGLEARVHEAVTALAGIEPLTPKIVGTHIAEKYKIATPSSGAIRAVWIRWDNLGFATYELKPLRFTGFKVEDSSWEALERLKSRGKTAARSAASAARRGWR